MRASCQCSVVRLPVCNNTYDTPTHAHTFAHLYTNEYIMNKANIHVSDTCTSRSTKVIYSSSKLLLTIKVGSSKNRGQMERGTESKSK